MWPDKFYWIKRNVKNDSKPELDIDKFLAEIDKGTLQPGTIGEEKRALQGMTPKPKPAPTPKPKKY